MNVLKSICLALVVTLVVGVPSFADSIGYLDIQKVLLGYKKSIELQEDIAKKREKLEKEFEKRQKKLEKAKDKNKSEEELRELITKLEAELEPKQKELIEMNRNAMGQLRAEILEASKLVAKSYGIDVVVDKQAVLYGGFDLTDFVLEKLNK